MKGKLKSFLLTSVSLAALVSSSAFALKMAECDMGKCNCYPSGLCYCEGKDACAPTGGEG